jgi:hydrogenase expression/formation protein HypC
LGVVQFGGIKRSVFLDFVPEAQVGDYVLVHVGFAISRLDEEEARRTYELLEHIGMLETDDPELGADEGTTAALSAIRGQ